VNRQISPGLGESLVAVMHFADVSLAVPLAEVHSLASVLDLRANSGNGGAVLAEVDVDEQALSVFAFDSELATLSALPDLYRVCVNLGAGYPELGILCQSIDMHEQAISAEALPACMASKGSILTGLAVKGEEVLLCSNLAALREYCCLAALPADQRPNAHSERA